MPVLTDPRPVPKRKRLPKTAEPAWDLDRLFPGQGQWTDAEYLRLVRMTEAERLVEMVDGRIEVLPAPTLAHQLINGYLYRLLFEFVAAGSLGLVVFSGMRVRVRERSFRMPDVVFIGKRSRRRVSQEFWEGADLAMEVVSEDDPSRDYVKKRSEYAAAGIKEYWIVDPRDRSITVLVLKGKKYQERGRYLDGQLAPSAILPGFVAAAVTGTFDAAKD
ncbi:MAG: hypothetical protein JWO31_2920 [Phycisphaerales bacterium]|nr:hypothetical protein [Phycisphaerales bacterium]